MVPDRLTARRSGASLPSSRWGLADLRVATTFFSEGRSQAQLCLPFLKVADMSRAFPASSRGDCGRTRLSAAGCVASRRRQRSLLGLAEPGKRARASVNLRCSQSLLKRRVFCRGCREQSFEQAPVLRSDTWNHTCPLGADIAAAARIPIPENALSGAPVRPRPRWRRQEDEGRVTAVDEKTMGSKSGCI
jgi:hypothetical protein